MKPAFSGVQDKDVMRSGVGSERESLKPRAIRRVNRSRHGWCCRVLSTA